MALEIHEVLYASLRRADMTQRDAAERLRISNQYLNDILRGRRRVTPELCASWAKEIEPGDKETFFLTLTIMGAQCDGWNMRVVIGKPLAGEEVSG